jgi:peptidoglycan/LPS O-acetylase OafA/YrhL
VPALDGVRGAAVVIVVFFHSSLLMASLRRFDRSGGLGVDAFFVLSGFLITALLLREQAISGRVRLRAFYRRRVLRLLPALVLLLAGQAIFAASAHLPKASEHASIPAVLFYYTNTWLLHEPIAQGFGALWSLAVEEQFYMVWPAVFILFFGLRRKLSIVTVVMTALIVVVLVHRLVLYQDGKPILYLYTRTSTRADALLVGALLAQLWVRGKIPKRGLTLVAWPALAFYLYAVVHGVSDHFLYMGGYTLIAISVALVLVAVLETQWRVNDVLRLWPLRAVGRVSYGLYIWHLLVFAEVLRIGSDWTPGTRLAVGLALSGAVTFASWTLVERPFLGYKARLERREARAMPSSERRSIPRTAPAGAVLVVAIAVVAGGSALWALSPPTRSTKARTPPTFAPTTAVVTVPDLVGKNAYAAIGELTQLHLNFALASRPSAVKGGDVVAQDPTAGSTVHGGTLVRLFVSTGRA